MFATLAGGIGDIESDIKSLKLQQEQQTQKAELLQNLYEAYDKALKEGFSVSASDSTLYKDVNNDLAAFNVARQACVDSGLFAQGDLPIPPSATSTKIFMQTEVNALRDQLTQLMTVDNATQNQLNNLDQTLATLWQAFAKLVEKIGATLQKIGDRIGTPA
jgi:predicted  nucleic acid-binding Zn-ribbon protein